MTTRRQILKSAVAPMIVPSVVLGQRAGHVPPSDKVVFGGIGIGSRGAHDLSKILKIAQARFVAVCDVRNERREEIKSTVDKAYGDRSCMVYDDQFEILARQDIDAVLIATGDRWHTPLAIIAAQHGKDVYCEKPCSMTIEETWALADTFKRYNRLYQAGCQRRNGANFKLCKELLHSGALGKLKTLYANAGPAVNWPPLPSRDWLTGQPLPPKQVLDWERWLGPAPWRPYHPSYVSGGWRNFFDFHGGGILEWGSHTVDLCQWAANFDDTQPTEYEPSSNKGTGYYVNCRYANGVKLVIRDHGWNGSLETGSCSFRIEGDQGWVETGDATKIECSENIKPLIRPTESAALALENHMNEFVACIPKRKQPAASAAAAGNTHLTCHAAFIAFQRGKTLGWDVAKQEFTNDEIANRMRRRAMREPWHV